MNAKAFWITIVAVAISFAGGFMLANGLNKSELNTLRVENQGLKDTQNISSGNNPESALSETEISQKIAEADANPSNLAFQKELGTALYRYALMKQDPKLLADVARLLSRYHEKNPNDAEVMATLGNIYFDIGYYKNDNTQFLKARDLYQKALEKKPNDVEIRTDLGLTYFLTNPPENNKAIAEFQKAIQQNPAHEKTLQALVQVFVKENNVVEAEKHLTKLKSVNQANQFLPELESQIAQLKTNPPK